MTTRTLARGSVEYVDVSVTADVALDGDVEISFDRDTWNTAAWVGDAGTTRTARVLVDTADLDRDRYGVWVRVHDLPEVPVLSAGSIRVV